MKQKLAVAEIGDTYTGEKFQRRGLFVSLVSAISSLDVNSKFDFIYGTPNSQSLPGYLKKTSFQLLANLKVCSWLMPLSTKIVHRKIPRIPVSLIKIADSVLIFMLNLHLRLIKIIQPTVVSIAESTILPDDWNSFATQFTSQFDHVFCRSKASVEWRFIASPLKYRKLFLLLNGQTIGYIFYREVLQDYGTTVIIADYGVLENKRHLFKYLFACAVKQALDIGAKSINGWCVEKSQLACFLKNIAFISNTPVPVIARNHKDSNFSLLAGNWHFTIGDTDNI